MNCKILNEMQWDSDYNSGCEDNENSSNLHDKKLQGNDQSPITWYTSPWTFSNYSPRRVLAPLVRGTPKRVPASQGVGKCLEMNWEFALNYLDTYLKWTGNLLSTTSILRKWQFFSTERPVFLEKHLSWFVVLFEDLPESTDSRSWRFLLWIHKILLVFVRGKTVHLG